MDTGDTAWLLVSTAMVMIMLPGLARFDGGLVRRTNVLSTVMHRSVGPALVRVEETGLDIAVHGGSAYQT